jgi:hypothetical protein
MKPNLKFLFGVIAVSLLSTACTTPRIENAVQATIQPAASLVPTELAAVTEAVAEVQPTIRLSETSTAIPTPAETMNTQVPPPGSRYWIFPPFGSGGTKAWKVDNSQIDEILLPDFANNMYDHSWISGKILHPSSFPGQGAGPANLSVDDLWIYDIQTQQDQVIFPDQNIVEAVFAPNGEDFVYLIATADTYELHWRSASGEDRLLAVDVSPTFSVSPDGMLVAFTRETGYKVGEPGVYIVSVDGNGERKIGSADRNGSGSISDLPIWSPDGQYILLPVENPAYPSRWVLLKTDGSAELPLRFGPEVPAEYLRQGLSFSLWMPDSQRVLGSQVQGMIGPPNGQETAVFDLDLETGIITSVEQVSFGDIMVLGWDKPGKSAWVLRNGQELHRLDLTHPNPFPQSCKGLDENWFINPSKGYCLTYPKDVTLQAFEYERPLFLGTALDQSIEPLQARFWVEANPVQPGTELSQAVDEFIAAQPQGDPGITRQAFTLAGQPAELLENVPGQLFSRVILAVHNDQLYQLWFNPIDPSVPVVRSEVERLFQAVIHSFAYLP